jgi:hypothetical protein
MVSTPNPKSHPKGKMTNLKKPPPNSEQPTMSLENTTRTTRQNYETFNGSKGDEKGMLRNTI